MEPVAAVAVIVVLSILAMTIASFVTNFVRGYRGTYSKSRPDVFTIMLSRQGNPGRRPAGIQSKACTSCGGMGRQTCMSCGGSGGRFEPGQFGRPGQYRSCTGCGGGGRRTCMRCGGSGRVMG
jgi:hypothetical protein